VAGEARPGLFSRQPADRIGPQRREDLRDRLLV